MKRFQIILVSCLAAFVMGVLRGQAVNITYTWDGEAGDGLWSSDTNWDPDGEPAPDPTGNVPDKVVFNDAAADRQTYMDLAGVGTANNHSESLGTLTVNQSTPGVTQTLTLQQNLSFRYGNGGEPTYNVSAGAFVLDLDGHVFVWRHGGSSGTLHDHLLPGGMTVNLGNDGTFAQNSGGGVNLILTNGTVVTGVGLIAGIHAYEWQAGSTLSIGAGTVGLKVGAGYHPNTFVFAGAINGDGVTSALVLGRSYDHTEGWVKSMDWTAGTFSIAGVTSINVGGGDNGIIAPGRFGAPASAIDLDETAFIIQDRGYSGVEFIFQIEAQTVIERVTDYKLGGITLGRRVAGSGKLTLQLVDTGSVDNDFVYTVSLSGLDAEDPADGSFVRLDLNDNMLMTDMSQAAMQAVLDEHVINSGSAGAPQLKSLSYYGEVRYYLAPATLAIPDPPPRGTLIVVR